MLEPLHLAQSGSSTAVTPGSGQPSLPTAATDPDGVLAHALDAVVSLDGSDLEAILTVAEASRSGVRAALCAAFAAEADRHTALARQARAAVARLRESTRAGQSTD